MAWLEQNGEMILTDSGGIQKEAYWLSVPCITLRDETEWVETVSAGWNVLAGADKERIVHHVKSFHPPGAHPTLYGTGEVGARCVEIMERTCG